MSAETLKVIVKAALEAGKAISKVTPTDLDDKIVLIADVIVQQILGLFSDLDLSELDPQTVDAIVRACEGVRVTE